MTLPPNPPGPSGELPEAPRDPIDTPAVSGRRARASISERARGGGSKTSRDRRSPAMLIAIGVHVVIGAVVVQMLTFGHGIPSWMQFDNGEAPVEERLTYIAPRAPEEPAVVAEVPKPTSNVTRPAVSAPSTGEAVAPAGPPVTAPARADTGSGGAVGTGNGVGALDPNVQGVRPGYTDSRVWQGAPGNGGAVAPGRNGAEKLDSIMRYGIMSVRDSVDSLARARGQVGRAPGDWTKTGKDGEKWGWDQQGIRLGKVTIPNALLALLPMNAATAAGMSGNMSRMEADRRIAASRADIMRMSDRSMGEAEFRKMADQLRDRRETERRARLRAPSATIASPVKSDKPSEKPGGKQN